MSNPLDAAFALLEQRLEEAEAKAREARAAINALCAAVGTPPRYPVISPAGGPVSRLMQIQDDTFYGKKQTPAMREYLEMRKAQGLGPAKPKELYEALKSGGYQFQTKNDDVALVAIRALLRTQPHIFHRLPQGTYGLTSWYPDAKRQKADASE